MIRFSTPVSTTKPRIVAWLLLVILAVLPGLTHGGCASADTPTRGWSLDGQLLDGATNRALRFELRPTGQLSYYAGFSAVPGGGAVVPTWSGPCTSDELSPIIDLLSQYDFAASPAQADPATRGVRYRLTAKPPGEWARSVDSGPTPELNRLFALLDQLQRRKRPDAFMPR